MRTRRGPYDVAELGVIGGFVAVAVLAILVGWALAGGHPLGRIIGEEQAVPAAALAGDAAPAVHHRARAHPTRPAAEPRHGALPHAHHRHRHRPAPVSTAVYVAPVAQVRPAARAVYRAAPVAPKPRATPRPKTKRPPPSRTPAPHPTPHATPPPAVTPPPVPSPAPPPPPVPPPGPPPA